VTIRESGRRAQENSRAASTTLGNVMMVLGAHIVTNVHRTGRA